MSRTTIFDDPYVRVIGPDTEQTMIRALEDAGADCGHPEKNGEYTSSCPAHPDQVRSLRWRVSVDGRVLLHCHAGCEFDAIMDSLKLEKWQTQPVKVEYDYLTPEGKYQFTVVREYGADGRKGFKQGRRDDDGMWVSNVDGVDTNILFRADAIAKSERGACHTLWLCEGEKDATVVEIELAREGRDGEYATTFPGGAARDLESAISDAITATGARTVVVVVDRDKSKAGEKRGRKVARWLGEANPDLAVRIMIPVEGSGKDVAELVDRFDKGWEARLEAYAFDQAEDALLDYGASMHAGSMVVVKSEVGRPVSAIVKAGKEDAPVAVLTGVVEPDAVHAGTDGRRYIVTITPSMHAADPIEAEIAPGDLASGQNFARWLTSVPEFGRVLGSGIGPGDVAESLRLYLDYRVRLAGKPVLVAPNSVGWVDAETGINADRAGTGRPLVFVDRDGRVVAGALPPGSTTSRGFCAPDIRSTGGEYGFELDEVSAAWAMWQALTFADADVTAPVLGFVAATILSPFTAAAGSGLRPGLTIVAPSGSGKTHGAAALILGLAGCAGHQSGSGAGMRRKLESGVGTMVWFDDSSIVEHENVKEWMRVAITRSEYTLSDTDRGLNATQTGSLTSVPVVSSEGVGWMAETAMRDRFIAVHPSNPQGRTSMWKGREGMAQWSDYQDVETGLLGGKPVRASGWVVAGLVEAARQRGAGDVVAGVGEALTAVGRGGVRREWARASAEAGLELAIAWLEGVREKAGKDWPGAKAGDWANSLAWLRDGMAQWAQVGEDRTAAAGCSLVDEVVPRLLQAHQDSLRTHAGHSDYCFEGIDATSSKDMNESIKRMATMGQGGAGVERGLPPIVIDAESRIWVRTATCASEYKKLVRDAEKRTTSPTALGQQLGAKAVGDDPAWATFIRTGKVMRGVRVRVGSVDTTYRRLSAMATERAKTAGSA